MSQVSRRVLAGGVYQPRSRGGAMADALADARRALARLTRIIVMRGAGAVLLLSALAAMVALLTYNSADASLDNASGVEPSNLLGGLGATAADILLQSFGLAAVLFLAPLFFWGIIALSGQHLRRALWRAFAWPMGTVLVAAGLGVLPAPFTLPAGTGGLIGIAVAALSKHVSQVYGQGWIAIAMPMLLLLAGLPLAFLATGLRLRPVMRGLANIPAGAMWLGSKVKVPTLTRGDRDDEPNHDYDEEDYEDEHEDLHEEDAYALDVAPEPIAATRLAERQQNRVKRDEAKRATATANAAKRPRQPALDLVSGEYQLPALSLLSEPVQVQDTTALSDEALEENARMLEAVLTDFGVKGRIMAVRPGPVV
ncbi:MAG TPA: DNA translocase FtsK 4TM domain-containing protein, partial [Rhizomicrobium sp.]|nr:DNA translocase FtsK 4TM domain-containing protein [Rhizomicrobium sp.]